MNPYTQFTLGLILIVIGAIVALVILRWAIRFILYEMAKENLLFTLRTEGEIRAIMSGETCVRYVMAVENHIIDPDDFDIFKGDVDAYERYIYDIGLAAKIADPRFVEKKLVVDPVTGLPIQQFIPEFKKRLENANKPTWFEELFGVVWVGFPPDHVFEYRFVWTKYKQGTITEGESGERNIYYEMIPREENDIDSVYFRYPTYGLFISRQETGSGSLKTIIGSVQPGTKTLEKIQVNLDLVFETVTRNPQKTLFRSTGLSSAGDWLIAVIAEIENHMRLWIGERKYDELLEAQAGGQSLANSLLTKVIDRVNKKTVPDYGQEVTRIRIVAVELTNPKFQESVAQFFLEKQKADAAVETARGRITLAEATRRESAAVLLGEADGFEAIANVKGGQGPGMYRAQQIGSGGIKVLSVGSSGGNIMNLPESLLGENQPPQNVSGIVVPPTTQPPVPIATTTPPTLGNPINPNPGPKNRPGKRKKGRP